MRAGVAGAVAGVMISAAVAATAQEKREGYTTPAELDVSKILEPAPRVGDPRYLTDREIFRATRKLKGTARWAMAVRDAVYNPAALMEDFSCAVGATLTPQTAPKLEALMRKAALDTARQSSRAKEQFQRHRPFTIDKGDICEPEDDLFDKKNNRVSYDYPSGHTTYGWTWALVLASAVPERAQEILARGRAYGDSRFICGSHNESAVEAGMLSASATMTLVATKPAYQADLAGVRAELSGVRASAPPAAETCKVEAALVAQRVMPRLDEMEEAAASVKQAGEEQATRRHGRRGGKRHHPRHHD